MAFSVQNLLITRQTNGTNWETKIATATTRFQVKMAEPRPNDKA